VRIRGARTVEGGAFGTVHVVPYVIVDEYSGDEPGGRPNGRPSQHLSIRVVLPRLRGNANDVLAGQRLLTCWLAKRNPVGAYGLELALVRFDVGHYDANFLTRSQGFEMVPIAQLLLGIMTARRSSAEADSQKCQHQKAGRRKRSKRFHKCLLMSLTASDSKQCKSTYIECCRQDHGPLNRHYGPYVDKDGVDLTYYGGSIFDSGGGYEIGPGQFGIAS